MSPFKRIVFLIFIGSLSTLLLSASSFAGPKKWGNSKKEARQEAYSDWRDDIRYSQGHHHDCNLSPGLAKKRKVPPGWAKKCGHQKIKHHRQDSRNLYPGNDHGRHHKNQDGPSIDGDIDIGVKVHIPFP